MHYFIEINKLKCSLNKEFVILLIKNLQKFFELIANDKLKFIINKNIPILILIKLINRILKQSTFSDSDRNTNKHRIKLLIEKIIKIILLYLSFCTVYSENYNKFVLIQLENIWSKNSYRKQKY